MFANSRNRFLSACGAALGLAALLGSAGCGKNRVTLDVDVASFIDPSNLTSHYEAPANVPPLELELEPVAVNLLEGSQDFAQAEEVSITVVVDYDNISGQGDASLTLFFDDNQGTVFSTPAVATLSANLSQNSTTTSRVEFQADARVIDLFTKEQMFMGVRFAWTPETGDALEGDYTITAIRAQVVSTVEIF